MGEGMSVQIAPDGAGARERAKEFHRGRRVGSAPAESGVPDRFAARQYALELIGDVRQHDGGRLPETTKKDMQPAGFELFDISKPGSPKSISFFDCSGPHSRGVHQLWFCDGEYVHCSAGSRDFVPTHPHWMPGTRQGDNVTPPSRHPIDTGFRAHNTNVYPQRPLLPRLYRRRHVRARHFRQGEQISRWTNSPPHTGFMHTVVPLFAIRPKRRT